MMTGQILAGILQATPRFLQSFHEWIAESLGGSRDTLADFLQSTAGRFGCAADLLCGLANLLVAEGMCFGGDWKRRWTAQCKPTNAEC
jgi:hypothetical protein